MLRLKLKLRKPKLKAESKAEAKIEANVKVKATFHAIFNAETEVWANATAKVKAKAKVKDEAKAEVKAEVKAKASKAKLESQTRHNGGTPDQTQRENCAKMALSLLKQNLKQGGRAQRGNQGGWKSAPSCFSPIYKNPYKLKLN